ncbi:MULTISPECIES: endolytic transglycosylase MltG [unclassified Nitratiruptor]|uniref:endolytic transglycosylase MltG n=1 Tax=unclassified Nitratiruptor TaxID=2624044 RepID=UPI0019154B8C|nr:MULTISPECIES: endolytic transglycosylase MltG [unclassified Nitratiruptor]
MARKIVKAIFFIVEIVLIIIVSLLFYFAEPIHLQSSQIYIPRGTISKIISYLDKRGIDSFFIDRFTLRFIGYPQSGWIDLHHRRLRRLDFLYLLTKSKAALIKITLIPGETTYTIIDELAKRYHVSQKVLQNEYNRVAPYPEGVFFPETYAIPKNMEPKRVIQLLVHLSLARHKKLSSKFYGTYNQKLWFEKIVTIASIIQKEAANREEMPLIASVIYNRLKKGMPLQMDGTLNYGQYSHVKVSPKRIQEDSSRFNTYKFFGLPPYPVCIVSKEAIAAAVFPAKTSYLYFVRISKGRHKFSKTYKNHLQNIKRVQK